MFSDIVFIVRPRERLLSGVRLLIQLQADLWNRPKSNLNLVIESPHVIFYLLAIALSVTVWNIDSGILHDFDLSL